MSVRWHLEELGGYPVHTFMAEDDLEDDDLKEDADFLATLAAAAPAPESVAWKIATHFDATWEFADVFGAFLKTVDTTKVRALVIGYFATDILDGADGVVPVLVEHAGKFPALQHLFVGDIVGEEHEISWIPPEDVTPLLEAFPGLVGFGYRFGTGHGEAAGPILRPVAHANLRRLAFQTGGMPAHLPAAVAASDLPALERLELWLGVEMYGGTVAVADLAGLLDGTRLPALRHLGLMNSEIQDEVASAVAVAPVVAQLESLDLSMGMLSDAGAEALLSGQPLTHLARLSVRHHFLSEPAAKRLADSLAASGVAVDVSERCTPWDGARTPEEGRYTEVSE
ncbi:STM4015 family protein [Yinghuangia soli]|uniref:STM4015 family protein n=1 Tax=Yinghuangia soli TaxID=2908204 RepID=A0AA41U2B3_9ACTN|nr:STM4015 family protein [Yinghuangia soli]MCF2531613.1 STM4015 family protein [Yinghuangia soli]